MTSAATHYLDHAATTPMRPSARAAWVNAHEAVGNPSSLHAAGRRARAIVEDSREAVAAALGAHPTEVVFTSGATEANNLAIQGASAALVVSSPIEHHSALDPVKWLETARAARVAWLPVSHLGVVEDRALRDLPPLEGARGLVSVHWVNNETGVVQPVAHAVEAATAAGYAVHSDAVQAVPYLQVDFTASGLTTMAVSAHKVGGPVGVGALLVRRDARLAPLHYGGGQQRFRSGTLDAAGAASFAVALGETVAERDAEAARLRELRDGLAAWFGANVPGVEVSGVEVSGAGGTGAEAATTPHILHVVLPGRSAEALLTALDLAGIEVSSGSACTAGIVDASHVLLAMGRSQADAASALRVSFGRTTTDQDIAALRAALLPAVSRMVNG